MKKNILSTLAFFCSFYLFFIFNPQIALATVTFSDSQGPLGKLVTVTGADFGTEKGEVIFYGTDNWDTLRPYREEKAAIYLWEPNQIIFQVPIRTPLNRDDGKNHFKIIKGNADKTNISESTFTVKNFFSSLSASPPRITLNPDQGLGMCHSVDEYLRDINYLSWAYPDVGTVPWNKIQPDDKDENYFDWKAVDDYLVQARSYGKKIWLQVGTTEGAIPDWAAYKNPNGLRNPHDNPNIKVPVAGTRCASRKATDSCITQAKSYMGCDASCSLDGKLHAKGTPIPWNEEYQRLLAKLIHKMAERYDGDPNIEAILVMGGGCYGELTICESTTQDVTLQWQNLGYTNEKFIEAVKKILDIYLQSADISPDQTSGFQKTPIVVQLGMGLYSTGSLYVSGRVADYADEKYGFRVWLKQNGLDNIGGNGDYYWYFKRHVGNTRVSYERGFWNRDCASLSGYQQAALNDNSSFLCGSHDDLKALTSCPDATLFSKYAGSQIVLQNSTFSVNNNKLIFTGQWKNLGNFPLIGQQRVGIKDIGVSYKLAFYFMQNGQIKGRSSVEPSWPTTNWFGPDSFSTENQISPPSGQAAGIYNVKLALEDENRNNLRFRLSGKGNLIEDSEGRYDLGNFEFGSVACHDNGDIDGIGGPQITDFNTWKDEIKNLLTSKTADFDCNQIIDLKDFEIWRRNFN